MFTITGIQGTYSIIVEGDYVRLNDNGGEVTWLGRNELEELRDEINRVLGE